MKVLTLFFAVCAALSNITPALAQSPCKEAVPGEFLVKFKSGTATAKAMSSGQSGTLLKSIGVTERKAFKDDFAGMYLVSSLKEKAAETLSNLKNNPDVEYAVPNCIVRASDTGYTVAGSVRAANAKTSAASLAMSYGMDGSSEQSIVSIHPEFGMEETPIASYWDGSVLERYHPRNFGFVPSDASPGKQAALVSLWVQSMSQNASNDSGGITLLENDRSTFTTVKSYGMGSAFSLDSSTVTTGEGDLDGDNISDVIIGSGTGWLGTGAGRYKVFLSGGGIGTATSNYSPEAIAVADLNGTGSPQLAIFSDDYFPGQAHYYYLEIVPYLGNGLFGPARATRLNWGTSPNDVDFGDLDGDGTIDMVVVGSKSIGFYLNDGIGNFELTQSYSLTGNGSFTSSTYFWQVLLRDMDNDGRVDILINGMDRLVYFWNDDSGFERYSWVTLLGDNNEIHTDDINRDGYLDITVTNRTQDMVYPIYNEIVEYRRSHPSEPDVDYWLVVEPDTDYQFSLDNDPFGARGVDLDGIWASQVTLRSRTNPSFIRQVKSDRNGSFVFTSIPAGAYTISATHGIWRARYASIDIQVQSDTSGIEIVARDDYLPASIGAPSVPPLTRTNDTGFDLLWGHHNGGQEGGVSDVDMDVLEAWSTTQGRSDMVVAVLDTGIDYRHPDLTQNIAFNSNGNGKAGFDAIDNDDDPFPTATEAHGTHVAGTIAAAGGNGKGIVGVAPNVKILPVRVLGPTGGGTMAGLINGLQYVISRRQQGLNVRIVNMSLGAEGACVEPLREAIQILENIGVVTVVAAGNASKNNDETAYWPSGCSVASIVSVAAVDRTGTIGDFSNYGPVNVDLAGPGVDIWSLSPFAWPEHPTSGYQTHDGTSMASPNVAGVAALMLSRNPQLSPVDVRRVLMETVKPLSSLTGKTGAAGIVSAKRALSHPLVNTGTGGGNNPGGGNNSGGGDNSGSGNQPSVISVSPSSISARGGKVRITITLPFSPPANRATVKVAGKVFQPSSLAARGGKTIVKARIELPANTRKKAVKKALKVIFKTAQGKRVINAGNFTIRAKR